MKTARRGAVILIAVVALSLVMLYLGEQARLIMLTRRHQQLHFQRVQAQLLARSARERADLRKSLSAAYSGETWNVQWTSGDEKVEWKVTVQPAEDSAPGWDTQTQPIEQPLELSVPAPTEGESS